MLISFGVKDAIDVLLVAIFIHQTYKLMKRSGNLNIFGGIVSVIIVWVLVTQVFGMQLMGAILDKFVSVGFIVLVILFQNEIRRFLIALGFNRGWRFLEKIFQRKGNNDKELKYIAALVLACMNMARKQVGALIVIQNEVELMPYIQTGEMFTAEVNTRLIENIFFKNSPLHDGAMIIANNKIRAAGCILPVAQHAKIPKELGLRHRAGLGIAQETDAYVIIISEERGAISFAYKGELSIDLTAEELQRRLSGDRGNDKTEITSKHKQLSFDL